jgi:16S rRNA (cytosine967-C5)-methyltransferase
MGRAAPRIRSARDGCRAPLGARERALALEAAARVWDEGRFATGVLAELLRREESLSAAARGRVAEAAYGLLRGERRLAAIADECLGARDRAGSGARRALWLWIWELRAGADPGAVARALRRALGSAPDLAALRHSEAGLAGLSGLEYHAVRLSWPTWLLARLVAERGEADALALAEALDAPAPVVLRANTLRATREQVIAALAAEGIAARPTRGAQAGLVVERGAAPFASAAFRAGLFEQMDEGSQLVAEVTAPPPRGRVLDACAGAGGKTLALAALLRGRGRVLALDVDVRRIAELRRRARRAGASNVRALAVDPGALPAEAARAGFERVLVDAPCSGLGTLRRNPEAKGRLSARDLDAFPARQRALLATYAPCVAPQGRLVYATCSVLPSENERVVEAFLREAPGFESVPLKEILGRERALELGDGTHLSLLPQRQGTDGFFAAVLRRRA